METPDSSIPPAEAEVPSVQPAPSAPETYSVSNETRNLRKSPDDHSNPTQVNQPLTTSPKGFDPITRPKHYTTHPSGIECIEVTRHMNFNLGNAIKYIWREKGNRQQDLEKAIWYLQDEIKRLS